MAKTDLVSLDGTLGGADFSTGQAIVQTTRRDQDQLWCQQHRHAYRPKLVVVIQRVPGSYVLVFPRRR